MQISPSTPPQTSAGSPSGRCVHSRLSCARFHVSSGSDRAPPGLVAYRERIWLPDGSEPPGGVKVKSHEDKKPKTGQYVIIHSYACAVTVNIPNSVRSKSSLVART